MKCTSCGNINLVKTHFPMTSSDGQASVSDMVDVYLCLDCGHYEFFSTKHVDKYHNVAKRICDKESKLDSLKRELSELENPLNTQKLNEEIKSIESQLTSLDITIRQQQELKNKLYDAKHKLSNMAEQIPQIKREIENLESDIHSRKDRLERGYF